MALITGGSTGIGLALAYELARMGYDLVLVSNDEAALQQAIEKINSSWPVQVHTLCSDLTAPDAPQHVFEESQSHGWTIDILINNAGMFFFGEVVETGYERNAQIMTLHTTVPVALCTLFGKQMKARRHGYILNISSISAWMPYPGIALYAGTKQFIKHFSRSLRTEMLEYGVHVTCVCPGAVSTGLYQLDAEGHRKARRWRVMTTPEKLAPKIIRKMFQRKALYIPGFLNQITVALVSIVPHAVIVQIRRHSKFLPPDPH